MSFPNRHSHAVTMELLPECDCVLFVDVKDMGKWTQKLDRTTREIESLIGQVQQKGLTLVPTRLYFKNGRAKLELAVARGKEQRDKRRDIAKREADRDMERALKSRG